MKIKLLTVLSLAVVLFLGACGGKSDADLQTAADTALKANPATSSVTVEVKDGVATISGEVEDDAAKAAAATAAQIEGVKSVTNNITVKPKPTPTASADDSTVKTKMEEALKKKGCDGATVEVKEGVATVRGSVATAKYPECVMATQEAGAKKVENQLGKK